MPFPVWTEHKMRRMPTMVWVPFIGEVSVKVLTLIGVLISAIFVWIFLCLLISATRRLKRCIRETVEAILLALGRKVAEDVTSREECERIGGVWYGGKCWK